jgi:hypothetical protein
LKPLISFLVKRVENQAAAGEHLDGWAEYRQQVAPELQQQPEHDGPESGLLQAKSLAWQDAEL